ncbi:MAG: hypothetical protein AAGE85_14170 [Pseudomonadota bacterium]
MPRRPLPYLLLLLSFTVLAPTIAVADRDRDRQCRKIDETIRKIEARMRRPYTAAQGVRFDERLRELKRKRYEDCR